MVRTKHLGSVGFALALWGLAVLTLQACAPAAGEVGNGALPRTTSTPAPDPCTARDDPARLFTCPQLDSPVYWLGDRLAVPGAPDLMLHSTYLDFRGDGSVPSETRVVLRYAADKPNWRPGEEVQFRVWDRTAWNAYLTKFTGYDPGVVPSRGPINWWQHPCVVETITREENGAEVHLFEAHLVSLIYVWPKTPAQVAECLNEPVGAVGAHVYFDRTVVQFAIQNLVTPSTMLAWQPVLANATPIPTPAQGEYPALITERVNMYNDPAIARYIAASLRLYDRASSEESTSLTGSKP